MNNLALKISFMCHILVVCATNYDAKNIANTFKKHRDLVAQQIDKLLVDYAATLDELLGSAKGKIKAERVGKYGNLIDTDQLDNSERSLKLKKIAAKFKKAIEQEKFQNVGVYAINNKFVDAETCCEVQFSGKSIGKKSLVKIVINIVFNTNLADLGDDVIDDIVEHEITHLKFYDGLVSICLSRMKINNDTLKQVRNLQEIRAYTYQFTRSFEAFNRNLRNYFYNQNEKTVPYRDYYPSKKDLYLVAKSIATEAGLL